MTSSKVDAFRRLHYQDRILLLPNAWDAASAMVFDTVGFEAIGTASWGVSAAMGCRDGEIMSFEEMLFVVTRIIRSVQKPVADRHLKFRIFLARFFVLFPLLSFSGPIQAQLTREPMRLWQKIKVEARPTRRGVSFTLTNQSAFPVSLKGNLWIEKQEGTSFKPFDSISGLGIRTSCTEAIPPCAALQEKQALQVAPWRMIGDAQCDCVKCLPIPQGTYRVVVKSCSPNYLLGEEQVTSSPFQIK